MPLDDYVMIKSAAQKRLSKEMKDFYNKLRKEMKLTDKDIAKILKPIQKNKSKVGIPALTGALVGAGTDDPTSGMAAGAGASGLAYYLMNANKMKRRKIPIISKITGPRTPKTQLNALAAAMTLGALGGGITSAVRKKLKDKKQLPVNFDQQQLEALKREIEG